MHSMLVLILWQRKQQLQGTKQVTASIDAAVSHHTMKTVPTSPGM